MKSPETATESPLAPELQLENIRANIRAATGEYLDPGIEEAVVMMNAFGFYTFQSCAGHVEQEGRDVSKMSWQDLKNLEHAVIGGPWISFAPFKLDEDDDPFEVELEIEEQTAADLELGKDCEELECRLMGLLDAFYQNRAVPADIRLIFEGEGTYELRNQGTLLLRNIVLARPERLTKLQAYQAEMNDFARFLKERYVSLAES